ncbi:hypothetical protein KY328_01020 [Candidatus Woesearchaeota archaeon]|nr:hypothetical protein [Candidatus Woesearchaeota archaeon]MBW3021478.1 hypothetical protein [Candidatus Woesearchaeota archaeon]
MGGYKLLALVVCIIFLLGTIPQGFAATINLDYDDNGNLVKDANFNYEYDSLNQLVKVTDLSGNIIEEYFYDSSGQRALKRTYLDGKTIDTYYFGEYVKTVTANSVEETIYYSDQEGLVAKKDNDGNMFYYHSDHLGSTDIVTDESGSVIEETKYLPFGEVTQGGDSRYLFTGQEKDTATELMYYDARYYSPYLRQFTQPDRMQPNIYDPQQLNRYSYVRNNPQKYQDPTGNWISPLDFLDYASFAHSFYQMIDEPSWGNFGWLALDAVFVALPVIGGVGAAGKGIKYTAKAVDKTGDAAKIASKTANAIDKANNARKVIHAGDKVADGLKAVDKANDVKKVPISKLWGHYTDDAKSLFRKGAKTHNTDPIQVIKVGDQYMINDGVGRSMRALKNGENAVNARVINSYASVDDMRDLASVGDEFAKSDLMWWTQRVTKIDDPARWAQLGMDVPK